MAINSTTFSGREFKVYVGADGDADYDPGVGTVNDSTNGEHMYRLDIEGITLPTFSPNQEFEMRTGTGRVAEFGAMFSSSKAVVTEFTLSGRLTLQDFPIFIENVLAQAGTETGNLFEIASGYSPGNFKSGDSTGATVWNKTLTVSFVAPTAGDSYHIPGCVVTNFQVSADMGTASGRYNYSATFQSMHTPTKGSDSFSSAKELSTALGQKNVFLVDQGVKDLNIMEYDGSTDETSIEPLFNNLSLTFDAPTQFIGQDTSGLPQVFARSVPELNITIAGSMKYDTTTDKMLEAHRDSAGTSYIQLSVNNRALTNGEGQPFSASIDIENHASQLFGFIIPKAKLISASVGSGDVATMDFEAKVVDDASVTYNKVMWLATGATA
jgi:hypothetical protein